MESRVSSIKNGRTQCFLFIQLKLETRVLKLETRYSIEHNTLSVQRHLLPLMPLPGLSRVINSLLTCLLMLNFHSVFKTFSVFRLFVSGAVCQRFLNAYNDACVCMNVLLGSLQRNLLLATGIQSVCRNTGSISTNRTSAIHSMSTSRYLLI